mmetsp:Transcript_15628/g.36585  ORF Transcript_15628/g.36585 Transcript_15628/m.36585 type:complete len:331 (-) Transcript_15628:92-1084(-)
MKNCPYSGITVAVSFVLVFAMFVHSKYGVMADKKLVLNYANHTKDAFVDLGLAVCIIGQMSRMELESKVRNLIQPAAESFGVGVFAVVEVNSSYFQNGKATSGQGCFEELTVQDFQTHLTPFYRRGLFAGHSIEKVSHPERWPRYAHKLATDMHQFRHFLECADLIENDETHRHGKYSYVMRIRDNAIVVKPFHLQEWNSATFKSCASWWGLNDKLMISPRSWGIQALRAPFEYFLAVDRVKKVNAGIKPANIVNSESVLLASMIFNGIPIAQLGADYLPISDGRCSRVRDGVKRWCLVPSFKDCHPAPPFAFNEDDQVSCTRLRAAVHH